MAKKKLTDWGSLSGDLEKDRKKEEQKPKTQTTQIGTGINNDWSLLTGNSKADRSNIAKRQEEYKKSAAAYQAQMDSINRTSKRSQVMMQGFHNDPVKQAQSEMDYHAKELARNAPLYQQISKEARKFSDYGTFNAAQSSLRQSSGNFADSYERYQQASQKAREDYLENLKQTNKSQYYAETMSRQQIEQKLGQLARDKGRAVTNADRASELAGSDQDRAKVYSSQAGDGRQPDYMRQLWDAKNRNDELDAEIARYQAALKYRNSLDKDAEMEELARSISSLSNFREMSEVGKAMVEGRNKSARASVSGMDYQPDDPDNNLQFARAEQQEREALGKAGYISDLDSSYIPEEVKPIYYALFVQSPQKAQEFAAYWADKGEQARWNALYEKSGEDAGERFKAFIEGTFANTVAGLDPFGEGGQYAAKLGKTMIGGGAAGLTEKGLFNTGFGAGTYHSDLFGDISLGSAYQLGSSMLQSAANATLAKMTGGAAGLVGGAGTILLGSSAAASDYQEKLEQGWDENAAKLHALAAGTAESLFEYVSMDKLIKEPLQLGVGAKWRDIIKQGVRNFFVQGGVEASEEVNTTLANRVTDALISELSGNENQIRAKVRELMEKGYEKGTAEKMAQQEWMTELMSDALGGFLSGGLMSSGQYAMYPVYKAMGAVETRRANERTGALSSRTGEAAALAQYAADNNLGWTAPEQSAEAVNQSESGTGETENADSSAAPQNDKTGGVETQNDVSKSTLGQKVSEAAEEKKTRKELRQERKETRQIGADVNRVRSHIQEQFAGKTVQQQEAIRDELVKKYGEGMELPVYRAVSMETAKQAMELESTDAIRQARETVLAEIQDEDMKRAVAEGYDQAAYQKAAQSNDLNAAAKYIQQVRNTGRGGMSMTATVTGEDGQSRQVRIADMTEDGKGVKLEDGTVVAAKDLVADADTMDVVKQLSRLNLGKDAGAVLQAFRDSGVAESEGYRWIMDYATAYEQGRTARISLKQAVERSSLDAKTVMDAYQKGQQYAQAETEKAEERKNKARKKGVTGRKSNIDTSELTRKGITYEKMTRAERQQYDLANKIFELIGVDLKWIASDVKTDSKGQQYYSGVNGSYLNGVVTLDIHAGQNYVEALRSGVLATTGHELTHFLEQYAPKQYKALKEFVFQQIVENSKNGEQTLERMIWEKQKRSNFRISAREAEHEVVADACQEMLLDSEAIREFAAENEEAAKGMVRWLRDFFARIKAAFKQSTELTEQAQFMAGLEKDVRKAFGKLWDEALREAVKAHDEIGNMENPATEGGEQDIQLSERDEEDYQSHQKLIAETVDKAIQNKGVLGTAYNQQKITPFPSRTAKMVYQASNGDIDVSQKTFALNGTEIYHEYIRHSDAKEIDRGQVPLTKRRYINAIRAVYAPDIVECLIRKNISGTIRQSFAYAKKTARGHYLVVEAVGGKNNPNVCPIEIFEVAAKTWEKYMAAGLSLGEILYQNNAAKRNALDIQKNKASRVIATQFASDEAIAHTSHSPRLDSSIYDLEPDVKRHGQYSDRDYNQTVVLTEQTVDKYLADYAAKSSPNYAQAYIVQMRPDDFLSLTTSKAGRDRIYRETGELDVEKLKDASIHQPFQLRIDSKTGQVEGHEGRHRAMALSNNGIRSIPVLLFDSSNKYNKTAMEELTLTGQDFGSSRSNATVTVQDVQPLSYANRDNVVQKFTRQPSMERMGERYGGKETIRYSERDSHGNELSAEQREYFKDSKAVDKDGNLLVLYRGKRGGETVIHGDYRGAIWTTTDPEFADRYGVKDELYANIKNPYYKTVYNTDSDTGYDIDKVIHDAKSGGHDGAIISFMLNPGVATGYVEYAAKNHPNEPASEILKSWTKSSYMDAHEGETIADFWKRANEGPVSQHVVAFSSEQIKRTDNLNPTENPDIRFSTRIDTEYLELAKDPQKNEAKLQEMVDEAAMEAGYTIKAYHGTTEDFTEFSRGKQGQNHKGYLEFGAGFYFTPSEKEASEWASRGKNGPARAKDSKVMGVYLNPGRIIDADAPIPGGVEYLQSTGLTKAEAAFVANRTYRFINYLLEDKGYSNLEVQETLKALGYDAIESTYRNRTEGQYVVFDPEQIKSADPVTYDNKHKPIPLSERFNDAKRDIRFSMRDPVEQTDRLIALHNLNAVKLNKALDLGGFPMPSIAVTKTSIPHTNFGPITLVMDKSTIDPQKDRRNTVYSADAWTPTFPSVEYEADEKAESRLRRKYYDLEKKFGRDAADPLYPWGNYAEDELNRRGGPEEVIDRYHDDTDMMKLFLLDSGLSVPENVKEVQVKRMDEETIKFYDLFVNEMGKDVFEDLKPREGETIPETRKRWWAEHGEEFESVYRKYMKNLNFSDEEISNVLENETISSQTRKALQMRNYIRTGPETRDETVNVAATKAAIRAAVDAEQYDAWLHGLFDGLVKSRGIYNGKDRYTPSGNSRTFASTHYSVTLENIAKAMAAQNDGNSRNVSGFYGVKSLRAGLAKRFSSIAEMHKYEGRLQHLTEEQAEKINDALADRLSDITARIYNSAPHSDYDSYFIAIDSIGNDLMEITEQKNITKESIQKVLSKYGYKISDTLAEDIRTLLFDVSQMPVNIYEAKPERAVRFNEVMAAVVPSNTDKSLIEKLRAAGVQNVIEYRDGDDTDRLEKVNSVDGAQFSERDYDQISDLDLMDNAVEGLTEAGGEEYWNALLTAAPELADDKAELKSLAEGYKKQGEKLAKAEAALEEAKRQMTPGGNRKLNTRGISGLALDIMKSVHAGDVHNKQVAKNVAQILAQAYQKGLNAIDAGKEPGAVWDIVYSEGVEKAADFMLENATYSEKFSYKWVVSKLGDYLKGEDGRWSVIDAISAKVIMDWSQNRMRQRMEATKADKLIERTENRMQKQIDEAKARAKTAESRNAELEENVKFLKQKQEENAGTIEHLGERLEEARKELKESKGKSAKEQKAALDKAKRLNERLQAKKQEAAAWKKLESRNEALLNAALKSKNEDIDALRIQMDRNATEAQKKQAALVKKLTEQVEREKRILEGKLKPPAMQRLLKEERDRAAREAEAHKDEVFANYKERQRQGDLRQRIRNLSDEMKRRMTNPSERAYVPASLYESMTRLADLLDDVLSPKPGTKAAAKYRAMMDAIHGLAREYSAVKDMDDPTYSSEYDTEIQDAISEIERVLERKDASWLDELTGDTKKGLRELSTGELQRIYELMRSINYSMVGASAMLGHSGFKDVFDAMRSVVDQQNGMESLNSLGKVKRWNRQRLLDNLSVMRAVEMMSGWERDAALYQLMHNIEQGTDESWSWVMDYNKSLQDLKTGKNEKEYRDALTKKLDFGVTDEEGRKVLMTKMQALQILMTAEREAHNDKLLHLQTGGAVIRDAIDLQNGKGAKSRSQTVKVTPELIREIQNGLTDWDRAYMKAIRSYFRKEGRRTNEILYKLKHKVLQTEDYYVPYNVDANYLETRLDENQAMNMWVKTPGSTNALKQKAKQPVIIDGMDTVMARHVKEIADYIGLAIPIRDFSKVYNGRLATGEDNPLPVKKTIDRTFGAKGQHLLTQAVIDVQGGRQHQNWSSGISDFLSKLQGAFVKSALLINPSVTIKQAASYIAAESVLSHRALVAGNRALFSSDEAKSPALIAYLFSNPEGRTAKRIYNEIDQHTSLHYQRRLGMSQAEIAEQANRNGPMKRWMNGIGASMEQNALGHAVRKAGEILNPVTWIQRMDVATTATLWVACKEQAKMDLGITDSSPAAQNDEFWQHTTELYERCIRETQPMYDGLHRTAHQKQAGGLVQFLFPFRTVPIQNHGQLAASYEALKASKGKSKARQAAAKKFFAKTVWAQTESAVVFSVMTFLAALLKRKTKKYRDEDEEFTAESFAKGLMTDVGSTLFSVLQPMYGSELVSLGSRAMDKFEGSSGYTYDAFSVGVVDMINDLASSGDKLFADTGKLMRGEDVSFEDFRDHTMALLTKGAKLAGIPADTVKTYAAGLLGNIEDIRAGRIPAINDESWDRATAVNANRFYKAWLAGDRDKMRSVLSEVNSSGKSDESIANAFNARVKEAYENNEIGLEQYADYLDKTSMFDTEKSATKIKNLVKEEFVNGERSEDDTIRVLTEICGMDGDKAWKTVQQWEAKAEHADEEEYSYSQYEDLREALDAGKSLQEAGAEYLEHGYSEKQIADAAVDHLRDRFSAGEISEDEAIRLYSAYKGKDENDAWKKVQEWAAKAEHADDEDYSYSQYDAIDEAIATNKDIKALVKELTDHGVEEKNITSHVKSYLVDRYVAGGVTESALKNQLSRYLGIVAKDDVDKILNDANSKKQYGVAYSSLDEEYRAGKIKASEMRNALMKYGGLSSADADKKIRWYDLQKANPSLEISESKANTWYDGTSYTKTNGHESAKAAGLSIQDYLRAKDELAKVKGVDANNDGRTDTGSREIAYIRALTAMSWLTDRQRRALYYEEYKGTSKTSKRPW